MSASGDLFDMSDVGLGLDETVLGCFNIMHSECRFLDAVDNIVQKVSFVLDGVYCFFQT